MILSLLSFEDDPNYSAQTLKRSKQYQRIAHKLIDFKNLIQKYMLIYYHSVFSLASPINHNIIANQLQEDYKPRSLDLNPNFNCITNPKMISLGLSVSLRKEVSRL